MIKNIFKMIVVFAILSGLFIFNSFADTVTKVNVSAKEQDYSDAGPGVALINADKKSEEIVRIVTKGDKRYKVVSSFGTYKTTAFTPEEAGNHTTATGVKPSLNHTVATDWSYIPAGTKILIGDSDIVYTVEDTGVKGNVVDIFLATNKEARKYGVKYKEIFLLEEIKE